ncbi:hypothetical protein AB6D59_21330 [Vibrio cyclitrophicus]
MKNLVSACSTEVGIATEVFSVLRAAKFGYQQYRMEQFLQSIQLCTDRMTEDERLEFRNRCLSDTGKRVAADFASAVTDTPAMLFWLLMHYYFLLIQISILPKHKLNDLYHPQKG